jgi:hypothetical protein
MNKYQTKDFLKQRIELCLIRTISFIQSAKEFSKSNFTLCDHSIAEERHKICETCEKFDGTEMLGLGKCNECGCAVWAKNLMASERCPIGKWESVILPDDIESKEQS